MARSRKNGFTMLELMIAVAIISLLVVIGKVGYRRMLAKTRRSEAISNLATLKTMMVTYASDSRRGFIVDGIGEYWGQTACSTRPQWVNEIGFDLGRCDESNFTYTVSAAALDSFSAIASTGEVSPNTVCPWIGAGVIGSATADRYTVNQLGEIVHAHDCISGL